MSLRPLYAAIAFLTVIPLPSHPDMTNTERGQSLLFFPLVGAFIGLLMVTSAWLLAENNALLAAVGALCISAGITGGLHLDGFADTADAWAGARGSRQRALAIMHDPHCGAIGVTALVLVCLLQAAAMASLIDHQSVLPIFLAPVLGRTAILPLFVTTSYVRAQGLGRDFADHLPARAALIVSSVIGVLLVLFAGWVGLYTCAAAMVCVFVLRRVFTRWIGGITGDTLGATVVIVETVTLAVGVFSV